MRRLNENRDDYAVRVERRRPVHATRFRPLGRILLAMLGIALAALVLLFL